MKDFETEARTLDHLGLHGEEFVAALAAKLRESYRYGMETAANAVLHNGHFYYNPDRDVAAEIIRNMLKKPTPKELRQLVQQLDIGANNKSAIAAALNVAESALVDDCRELRVVVSEFAATITPTP